MIDAPTATIIAALIVGAITALSFGSGIMYRLAKLEKTADADREAATRDNAHTREMLATEIQSVRTEIQSVRTELQTEIQSVRTEIQHMQEQIRAEHEATRMEIRRLVDALMSHRHDTDGETYFRIPPPTGSDQ